MKTILSIVLNTLDNDTRVLKIGNLLRKYYKLEYTALSKIYIRKFFIIDYIDNIRVYRIKYAVKNRKNNNISEKQKQKNVFNPIKFLYDILWLIRFNYILFRVLIYKKYDIYYCNDFNTLISGYFAAKKKRAKIIYDTHELWAERSGARNTTFNKFKRIVEYFIEWFLINRVDLVITVSDGIADELVRRYHIKKPLVIRNLDTIKPLLSYNDKLKLRKQLNIPQDCILIVYQGGMHRSRGIYELIEAMDQLDNNIHLLLMGPKPKEYILERINKNKRIHYIGMIPENELHNYTCIADIGIHPMKINNSLNHKLALPNKFSQYMNASLALALCDNIEARNIIERGKCGEIFNSDNINSIVQAINRIISSGKLNEYKRRSRELFLKEYNWDIDKYKLLREIKRL